MPNAYIEIYTEEESKDCLSWMDKMSRVIIDFYSETRGMRPIEVYSESYQGEEGAYSYIHYTVLLKHEEENAYQMVYDFVIEEGIELMESRPEDCHILLIPQTTLDYKDGLGLGNSQIVKKYLRFPITGSLTRFVGYSKVQVIIADKQTGFSVIANGHRSSHSNTELAGQYLYSRIRFNKRLPKNAIWH